MTIKEMEAKTGMSRANIRYYEAEGLIHPARQENGYRIYSEADVQTLLKIRLLRSLDISLDAIRALQAGTAQLPETLKAHLDTLSQKQLHLTQTQAVTERLLAENATFAGLEPMLYLAALESGGQALTKDVVKKRNLPWRRYWARCFDLGFYSSVINGLLFRFALNDFLAFLLPLIATVLLEPLFLHLFATTPGKAVFGITVTDTEGGKLTYGGALERTWLVLWEGQGLGIPFVTYYFLYKSYAKAEANEPLPWENDSDLSIRDAASWRYGLLFGLMGVIVALETWVLWVLGG